VHYTGTLLDGTKFDSSRDRSDPFKFKLGAGQVIKGWDRAVATMKRGEQCRVVLRSDYAYGASGSPPTIPANATLGTSASCSTATAAHVTHGSHVPTAVFDIELLSWKDEEDLTHDGGVLKKVLRSADGWEKPSDDSEVKVSYTVSTADGQHIESKTDYTFALGAEAVPTGLEKVHFIN
jgi:FK506-binding protein 4/5